MPLGWLTQWMNRTQISATTRLGRRSSPTLIQTEPLVLILLFYPKITRSFLLADSSVTNDFSLSKVFNGHPVNSRNYMIRQSTRSLVTRSAWKSAFHVSVQCDSLLMIHTTLYHHHPLASFKRYIPACDTGEKQPHLVTLMKVYLGEGTLLTIIVSLLFFPVVIKSILRESTDYSAEKELTQRLTHLFFQFWSQDTCFDSLSLSLSLILTSEEMLF